MWKYERSVDRLSGIRARSARLALGVDLTLGRGHAGGEIMEGRAENLVCEHCHHAEVDQILEMLGTDLSKGLDRFEVEHRRQRFGPNALTERRGRSPFVHFLLQFNQPLVYLLLAAALAAGLLHEIVDAAVIVGVVVVNAIIGFIQEAKALKAIQALSRSLPTSSTVLRAGKRETVPAADLVPGDLVLLQSGDKVPADLRIAQSRDLRVDESALTGEAVPASKASGTLPRETALGDRSNMAFSSTLVTYGTGIGIVVATGDATEIGRISDLIASAEALETPLTRRITRFSRLLMVVVLGLAALTFFAGLLRGQSVTEMLMASIALAVGAIPEGLPAAVTIILAIGVARMARRRAIIRRLPAVETLGSTTVICTDKTGTVTQNQMTVRNLRAGADVYSVIGTGYSPQGEILLEGRPVDLADSAVLREVLLCGLLCNDADLEEDAGRWTVRGDPTEGALLSVAAKAGMRRDEVSVALPRIDGIPFESQLQFMATLHDDAGAGSRRVYVKGALESLLARCESQFGVAGPEPLDAALLRAAAETMASEGLRVLAFARKDLPASAQVLEHADVELGLILLGLQGMMDPPREEAAPAVAACQRAGIQVKMITGDHAATAAAIAAQVGILRGAESEACVLTGADLQVMSDQELIECVDSVDVFARVSPEHKLRLVEALQARGHVVAMTGDGVNDAPALRQADIGVAMARGGTEVAREAADMVLTDDNFASIEAAVEEGRGVFDNLQKFIVWTLPTNGGEALVLLAAVLLGLSLPILPVQILWINMMTSICLGMTLAFEPKEQGIMSRRPTDPRKPLLTAVLGRRILLVSLLLCGAVYAIFELELARGASLAAARTAATAVIVFGEAFYLFNCRSFTRSSLAVGWASNPWTWLGVGVMAALQVAFTYVPAMNQLFASEPISWDVWLEVMGLSLAVAVTVGATKWLGNRSRRAAAAAGNP
jgi:cation-transporting P-type ATPase F